MAQLLVVQGEQIGQRFDLTAEKSVVGRESGCEIRVKDPEISRRHVMLIRDDLGFRIRDLGSSNGTTLNDEPVRETRLKRGDKIQVGQTVLLFVDDLAIRAQGVTLEQVRIVPPDTGEDKSAIVQALPVMADMSQLFAGNAPPFWLQERLASLDVIYKASREINLITDPNELLPRILELVFDAIGADRGAILLTDNRGVIEPRAVRCRGVAQKGEKLHISHSIVDHVLHQRQGVICTDTLTDSRFSAAPSVMQLGIREAICVPLQGRHSILGVIYADHRSVQELGPEAAAAPQRRFSQDHLALMVSIGHQAGLAVENSSLYQAKLDAERLAAIGQTIAIVSHHVKNVLQGLKGGSGLIRSGLETGDLALARRGDAILERNLDRVYDLVLDMLSYSKTREPSRTKVVVHDLIQDLVELMRPRAESQKIRISAGEIPQSIVALLDEEGMHRAILNLITNAMDALAGRENGQVTINAALDEAREMLTIDVDDNGAGIAPEDMNHLFELFESTKGSKGTGLGLPVSDKIIREHGGRIRVESQLNEGARFIIEIPVVRADLPEAAERLASDATLTESEILRARAAISTNAPAQE